MFNLLQRFIINRYSDRILNKWIVLLFDTMVLMSFGIAYLLRFNFDLSAIHPQHYLVQWGISSLVYLICFTAFSSYSGIIRHTGMEDVRRILQACTLAMLILLLLALGIRSTDQPGFLAAPLAVIIIHGLLSFIVLTGSRIFIKVSYHNAVKGKTTTHTG